MFPALQNELNWIKIRPILRIYDADTELFNVLMFNVYISLLTILIYRALQDGGMEG